MQAHISGQISGQLPRSGTHLTALSHQNGGVFHPRLQTYADHRNDMHKIIYEFFTQWRHDLPSKNMVDIVRQLEEGLFNSAGSMEDYMNSETLENRLFNLISMLPVSNHNQHSPQFVNSFAIMGAKMTPTPGMMHCQNSNFLALSEAYSMIANSNISQSVMPLNVNAVHSVDINGASSFNSPDGAVPNEHQQSSFNSCFSSSGENTMSSLGMQKISNRMIPTPGFNNNTSNQSYMNLKVSSPSCGLPTVMPKMVSLVQQQMQPVNNLNNRIPPNFGCQSRSGMSGIQQNSYRSSNGPLNDGLGMLGNKVQAMIEPAGTSEGCLTPMQYDITSNPLQQKFDQHHQPLMQGGGVFGMGFSDSSGSTNSFVPVSSGGSVNIQNSNSLRLQDISKLSSQLTANQKSLQYTQPTAHLKREPKDVREQLSFGPALLSRQYQVPSHHGYQHIQQQHPLQFQCPQKSVKYNLQQKQQHLLKNGSSIHSQLTSEFCNENEVSRPEISDHQNQLHQNSTDDHQMLSIPISRHNSYSSHPRCSQQMEQVSHLQQFLTEPQSDFSRFPAESQSKSIKECQWISQSGGVPAMSGSLSSEQHKQDEAYHEIGIQNMAHCTNSSSHRSIVETVASSATTDHLSTNFSSGKTELTDREKQFLNQQRWLLFIRHARRCEAPEGKCPEIFCLFVQRLWRHMLNCNLAHCPQPRCHPTRVLLGHYKNCCASDCPVCVPVRNFLQAQYKRRIDCELPDKSCNTGEKDIGLSSVSSVNDLQPAAKKMKMDHDSQSLNLENESSAVSILRVSEPEVHHDLLPIDNQHSDVSKQMKYVVSRVEVVLEGSGHENPIISEITKNKVNHFYNEKSNVVPDISVEVINTVKQENVVHESIIDQSKQESVSVPFSDHASTKCEKPKIKGVSLTELFTLEQIREHIIGLRQWVGQSKAKAEKNQAMEHLMSENCCQLCAVEKLIFEPPPIYCTPCGARIKRNAMYYTMVTGVTRHYLCNTCYIESRGDTITFDGTDFSKAKLDKKKNDEETEEGWVQCDKCEAWQHQICALFNGRRNDGGQAEYTCPNCYIAELERGERKPLLESAVLGAKDLPRTLLSDHIENRLFRSLKEERQERASVQGKSYDEVPRAEALVVRVVSSVDKKLNVKQRFLEIFQKDNHPIEFPYKSKVVLLFQKIEGVEVCLFGMYLQEFGSECQYPNQRHVYLSYLDSVKYFRPDIKAVTGEALRTFVYHEILIGYLEYCKLRGFTTCYIWACPPLKGEDYILYCHPEIQKTPKSDKLRNWYLSMLRKASKEDIVVDLTNLYDHFFASTGECKAKITAARLPYFDGDYWPGAAEDILYQISQEEDAKKHNKGAIKKIILRRAPKSSSHLDLSVNPSKDLLLMHKLGEAISPMKEDFIMVHLQHACSHCCRLMVSGNRWICKKCKNFQLCDKCYDGEQKLGDRERHPIHQWEKHTLFPVQINVAANTKDKDEILESEFFDTRQAFLSLCQGNHYQYDTLRRAKHSSMMLLYHLHNPTAPAFVTTCIKCCLDIETSQGWRCEICADYEICSACYEKDGGVDHPHKLTNHPSTAECDYPNKGLRQSRDLQRRKMLELLVHAAKCRSTLCPYPNCRKVKGLFSHGNQCKTRAHGGCVLCKKMWFLIHLHVRACNESQCSVPRCSDMRKHLTRLQQQSESRRRAAVNEMMRNRVAD